MARVDLKESFTNAIANTSIVKEAIKRASSKIDDDNEYMVLKDIKLATVEPSNDKKMYLALRGLIDDIEMHLNYKGIEDGSLNFYAKYLRSNSLSTVLKSKTDKVISNSTKLKRGEKDIELRIDKLKQIQDNKSVYGKFLIKFIDKGNDLNEASYTIIEPYRYRFEIDRCYIYSYYETKRIGAKTYSIFERLEISLENNNYRERLAYMHLDDKGNEVLEGEAEIGILNYKPYFEITNTLKGESDLKEIRTELFLLDLCQTVEALEVKGSQFSIHASEDYFENGRVIVQDFHRIYSSTPGGEREPLFKEFQPLLRVDSYEAYKQAMFTSISKDLGITVSGAKASVNNQVATIAILDEEKTAETINNAKYDLRYQIQQMLDVLYGDLTIEIPSYTSQSLHLKAQIVQQIGDSMSIESKVDYLHTDWTLEQKETEVIRIKMQSGFILSKEQEDKAIELGLMSA